MKSGGGHLEAESGRSVKLTVLPREVSISFELSTTGLSPLPTPQCGNMKLRLSLPALRPHEGTVPLKPTAGRKNMRQSFPKALEFSFLSLFLATPHGM